MKTFTIYAAKAGKTWLPNWKPVGSIRAKSAKDAARRHLTRPRQLAACRFTTGNHDYIFSRE